MVNTDAVVLSYENGGIAEPNELGEIAIRGPQVMQGYWNKRKKQKRRLKMVGC